MKENRMLSDEILLGLIKKNGGGGGGTTNYNNLDNLPQIGGVTLQGNKTLSDLGIASATALANKVDKVEGKGLSTNDYTDDDKSIVGGVTAALATKVDKVEGKGLSSNDFTDADKTAIESNTTAISGIKDGESINSFSGVESALSDVDDAIEAIDSKIDDTTEYPYADVITIEDAVPANLADCSVKVEPVQDLHGYDKPWVGGAGYNKLDVSGNSDFPVDDDGYVSDATPTVDSRDWSYSKAQYKLSLPAGNYKMVVIVKETTSDNASGFRIITTPYSELVINWDTFKTTGTKVYNFMLSDTTDIGVEAKMFSSVARFMILPQSVTSNDWQPYTNICPISGHTEAVVTRDGKNLWEFAESYSGAGGLASNLTFSNELKPNTYTISCKGTFASGGAIQFTFLCEDGSNQSITLGYNKVGDTYYSSGTLTKKIVGVKNIYSNNAGNSIDSVQLELGSTATPYEPYAGQQYTLALGDTIYGGTVDFESGVMTVDRAYYTIASASDFRNNQGSFPSSAYVIDVDPVGKNNGDIISNKYEQSSGGVGVFLNSSGKVRINTNESYESKDAALSGELSGVQIVYELATPTTIQLTPQQIQLLQGTNTLYASTGQISVTVNGVSGAIGQVQEQVNELAEEVEEIKPVDYSTTEQATGRKWLNDPTYIVVIDMGEEKTVASNTWYTVGNHLGAETIVNGMGVSGGGGTIPMQIVEDTNDGIKILQTRNAQVGVRYVWCEYTKVTT